MDEIKGAVEADRRDRETAERTNAYWLHTCVFGWVGACLGEQQCAGCTRWGCFCCWRQRLKSKRLLAPDLATGCFRTTLSLPAVLRRALEGVTCSR